MMLMHTRCTLLTLCLVVALFLGVRLIPGAAFPRARAIWERPRE